MDPEARANSAPIVRWAMAIWYSLLKEGHPMAYTCLGSRFPTEAWRRRDPWKANRWQQTNGPMVACALSGTRMGWNMQGPTIWENYEGMQIDLFRETPKYVDRQITMTVLRHSEIYIGHKYGAREWFNEEYMDHVERARCHKRALTTIIKMHAKTRHEEIMAPEQQTALRVVFCDAIWRRERWAAIKTPKYMIDTCAVCGLKHPDDVWYRVWKCNVPEVEKLRRDIAGRTIIALATNPSIGAIGVREHPLYSRGIATHVVYEVMQAHGTPGTGTPNEASPATTFERNGIRIIYITKWKL